MEERIRLYFLLSFNFFNNWLQDKHSEFKTKWKTRELSKVNDGWVNFYLKWYFK